jgi:PEP-CTERM motif
MRKSLHLAASAVVLGMGVSSALATTISSTSTYTTVTSIGVGQTVGTDGWFLANSGPQKSPAYATLFTVSGNAGATAASITLYTATNTTQTVSTNYYYTGSNGVTLSTITLTGTVPAEFQLGILSDNEVNGPFPCTFKVTDTNPLDAASGTVTDSFSGTGVDNFYLIDITGASSGDVLSVSNSGSTLAVFGGLSFDTIPTPEPSALSLLGVGAVALLARRRRKTSGAPEQHRIMGVESPIRC